MRRIFRSVHPHAKILKLDTTRAEQVPGVVAVVIGKELAAKIWNFASWP